MNRFFVSKKQRLLKIYLFIIPLLNRKETKCTKVDIPIDWLPIFHSSGYISQESFLPSLGVSQSHHTAQKDYERHKMRSEIDLTYLLSVRGRSKVYNSYNAVLLCCVITVTSIKTTCLFTMLCPCSQTEPTFT